ncbi:hypothetical protein [Actinoplanes couchii]|uniref:Lipoprotein n=1 Tax=Actinoplanes couchii TaxID=403638 RepID=A0ABQ3XR28_9ACTN|nr:hypothetical protein [Actinoplanes couchii]MDR6318176.1 hypothetical protein [Actinoplanes couchii]GID60970.1 hypothetical protein Aco03nite_093740 [Actinoplanes couchii]
MSYRTRLIVVTAGLALALSGCSGAGDTAETPSVATLQSGVPAAGAAAGAQRPVYRMDATEDEIKALAKPWMDCLAGEGVQNPDQALGVVLKGGTVEDLRKVDLGGQEAAWKTCLAEQPESFEQNQLRSDPTEFKDNQREWYRCAQAAGYKLTAPDPETGQFGITEVGPNGDFGSEKMQECRRQAFEN